MAVNTELYSLKGSGLPYTPKISERLLECSEEGYTSGFGGFSNESSLSKLRNNFQGQECQPWVIELAQHVNSHSPKSINLSLVLRMHLYRPTDAGSLTLAMAGVPSN